jgi:hypothetical protein
MRFNNDGRQTNFFLLPFQNFIFFMIPIDSCQHSSCPDVLVTAPFMGLCDGAILEFPFKLSNNLPMNKMKSTVSTASFSNRYSESISAIEILKNQRTLWTILLLPHCEIRLINEPT